MLITDIIVVLLLLLCSSLAFFGQKLTVFGAFTAFFVGFLTYLGGSFTGLGMLVLFFLAGTLATGWQVNNKAAIGYADRDTRRRTAGQVLANGGITALAGLIAWCQPSMAHTLQLMMAGSLAAAIADTLSSELGTVYGSRYYNILTFKIDERGRDGVVSLEGTVIGVAGAVLVAAVYAIGFGRDISLLWIVIAGTTGNLADSVLGAALERKGIIGNNIVNLLNTLTGAIVCYGLSVMIA